VQVVDMMMEDYDNVGTVLQTYLYNSAENVYKYKDSRTRLVKGAYKENPRVALQKKDDIDAAYEQLIRVHLTEGDGFTSIATHDRSIINDTVGFLNARSIANDKFEFQILYGFIKELLTEVVERGYIVCVDIPFGNQRYAYLMRRLAERP